ncbi:hypothetical protein [Dyadobacter frigoris]|uniref:Uncharacterized protein n=1 Tax=Dyadobacter frigoris TaxID=2576211 RepID=A0A4U6D930_9BACT|nr:hypothetical protein [Dyadobacter frigoris]TKT92777.1 hypothetical protein FDK13_08210 [Dyadobacter frigoris]GLU51678.1 hypothetical protein Dfri01_11390 [Dyadobacter frigoris]
MKSLSTFIIAVCLFVLCLFEKEAKQQALDEQKLREKSSENQVVNNQKILLPVYGNSQKNSLIQGQFQIAQFVASDSLSSQSHTSESL